MKNSISLLLVFSFMFTGCAVGVAPSIGALATATTYPLAVGEGTNPPSKIGESSCLNLLGLIAVGDAGIDKAVRNSGITEICYVDYESLNVLFLFHVITVKVYGN